MLYTVCSIYREIKILRYLGHHPNIIRILHLQRPSDLTTFKDLCVIAAHVPANSCKQLRSGSSHCGFVQIRRV